MCANNSRTTATIKLITAANVNVNANIKAITAVKRPRRDALVSLPFLFIFFVYLINTVVALPSDRCFYTVNNETQEKELGAVWFSPTNPCHVYSCSAGTEISNSAHIVQTNVDCSEFYCDVDSELQSVENSCCGECVRTRCRYNDTVYEVGQTWHNDADCMLLECVRLADGLPMVNSYLRTCPPLPAECTPERVYTENCCQYCRSTINNRMVELEDTVSGDDTWTAEFYRSHPCARTCNANDQPMTCHYTFVVEWYQTLSKACFDCPRNLTDCDRPHCIATDGISRSVTVVNRMMPGPAIEVCEGDTIVVDVRNNMLGESTTMHWHGLHQRHSPYMDGVPHITQCPISPHASFRYTFKADLPGTHFWHSHTGMQRGDGVYGALIIHKPKSAEPHGNLYDFDLSEHVMIVQDWIHMPGVSMFADHHHSRGDNKPRTLLVNGKGRFYNYIWETVKKESKMSGIEAKVAMPKTTEVTNSNSNVELFQSNYNNIGRLSMNKDNPELPRQARLVKLSTKLQPVNITEKYNESYKVRTRNKRSNVAEPELIDLPLQVYTVRRGFRYRFRIINAEFLNCPIVVSVDNHTLTAINSDSFDFEAIEVGSIVTYAGERFDFILNANQPTDNYWVRLKGLMDCSDEFTSAFQVAILRYEGAGSTEPVAELKYDHKTDGIELNVMNRGPGFNDTKTIAELVALPSYDKVPGIDQDALKPVADYKFFVYYDFYAKDNPEFHSSDLYGFTANLTRENLFFTPQLNHISLKFPSVTLLSSRNYLNDSLFCNETSLAAQGIDCRKQFCKCHHVLQVPLNAIVELIIVDEGFAYNANHPFHLHGNAFRVIGLERLGENVTIDMVKQLDRYNLLKRNLINPPVKDTVTVPDGGYTIIRFEAYNPGFWLFHCHIEFHAEIGMALVFKVGDNDQMPAVPKNFPTCKDYMPETVDEEDAETSTISSSTSTSTQDPPSSNNSGTTLIVSNHFLLDTVLLLLLTRYLRQ